MRQCIGDLLPYLAPSEALAEFYYMRSMGSPRKCHFLGNPRNSGHSSSGASENMQKTHKKCITFHHTYTGEMLGYVTLHRAESMWNEDPRDIRWKRSLGILSPTSHLEQDHHQIPDLSIPWNSQLDDSCFFVYSF